MFICEFQPTRRVDLFRLEIGSSIKIECALTDEKSAMEYVQNSAVAYLKKRKRKYNGAFCNVYDSNYRLLASRLMEI